ncbi:MAG TPA: hypothetical protein VNX25_08215 [Verrucomicrobiae bacterium]|nr:hypothetical protein [Verrucomicrobiae bacterium]
MMAAPPVPPAPAPPAGPIPPLHVEYGVIRKILLLIVAVSCVLPLAWIMVTADDFVLHIFGCGALVCTLLLLYECLGTTAFVLYPDRIVKKRLFSTPAQVPAVCAVMTMDQHVIRFCHGSRRNFRERITIIRYMVNDDSARAAVSHAEKHYGICLKMEDGFDICENPKFSGCGSGKNRVVSRLLLDAFHQTVFTYRLLIGFFVAYALIVVFTAGLADDFQGVAPEWPAAGIRAGCIAAAVTVYFLLRRFDRRAAEAAEPHLTWADRMRRLENVSFASALSANGVALLGLALFFIGGNLLDFYMFLAVGCFYFGEFHPRLSRWEAAAAAGHRPHDTVPEPVAARRRSLHVSLVLMGTLAVAAYGEEHRYLYKNKKDCLDDWGSEQDCQEPPPRSVHFGSGRYYGPRYGGSTGKGGRAVGRVSVSRGGFGSLGSFHASFGG